MSGLSPTEEKFEEHIEKHMCSVGIHLLTFMNTIDLFV